ncbi:MAG: hypothetical protein KDA61_15645, partial [Planctomycetales bacterium]|nr:hypothetical protein [Planctomycetales bacterium]
YVEGMEIRFFFDVDDGSLAAVELYPFDGADPCELILSDYQPLDGDDFKTTNESENAAAETQRPLLIPRRWAVRFGDALFCDITVDAWTFGGGGAPEHVEKQAANENPQETSDIEDGASDRSAAEEGRQ